ncbi:MAG: hypothetical protein RIS76_4483 [Verrucomicrobiota bacterium]|jgi:hypothetical protein
MGFEASVNCRSQLKNTLLHHELFHPHTTRSGALDALHISH